LYRHERSKIIDPRRPFSLSQAPHLDNAYPRRQSCARALSAEGEGLFFFRLPSFSAIGAILLPLSLAAGSSFQSDINSTVFRCFFFFRLRSSFPVRGWTAVEFPGGPFFDDKARCRLLMLQCMFFLLKKRLLRTSFQSFGGADRIELFFPQQTQSRCSFSKGSSRPRGLPVFQRAIIGGARSLSIPNLVDLPKGHSMYPLSFAASVTESVSYSRLD